MINSIKASFLLLCLIAIACNDRSTVEQILTQNHNCWIRLELSNQNTFVSTNTCIQFNTDGSINQYFLIDSSMELMQGIDKTHDVQPQWQYYAEDSLFLLGIHEYKIISVGSDSIIIRRQDGTIEALVKEK